MHPSELEEELPSKEIERVLAVSGSGDGTQKDML
jgi:hypothetical protein